MDTEQLMQVKQNVQHLVDRYNADLHRFQHITYNETEVRIDFVNPLFTALGWDVANEAGLPQHLREVTHEATVYVNENGGLRGKKPDYAFRVGTEKLFYLETKKPYVNITVDRAPAFQLRRYGWSGNLKISVLTNFEDLYIYDCSVRPVEGDDIGIALIAHYHYTEYVEKIDEIYRFLSKESAISGRFDELFGTIQGAYTREPFNAYFLEQIKNWRNAIGRDLYEHHREIDSDTLNIFVQKLLNRIIFLRICEDRSFENYEALRTITSYNQLKGLFLASDQKYDSGLFEMLDEDQLSVSDDTIISVFQDLYYPNNSYEFSVIDPYIIGQIYEIFLDESLEIQNDSIVVVPKPEVVDYQGTVNTPKNVTDIIVEKTLSALFSGKTIEEIANYKVADICCGSGNFLLSAYEFIVNYFIDSILTTDRVAALQRGDIIQLTGTDEYTLAYPLKRTILETMIYGVDIDPLAIEVTKFSLVLKVLEGTEMDELTSYHIATNNRILPNIDGHIKLGNSLVGAEYGRFNRNVYTDVNLLKKIKIKMFDWHNEFQGTKFDAIIGNPPYIRVQNMVHYSPEEYAYYKGTDDYITAQTDTLDKYYLFIERGLSLLKGNGYLGYIVPHKFMNIKSGKELRKLLSENENVKEIYHFGTQQVFANRSTYTCILLLSKARSQQFGIAHISDLSRFMYERDAECAIYDARYLSSQPWAFLPQSITDTLSTIEDKCTPLSNVADIFVGLQTSADSIYIIHAEEENEEYVSIRDADGQIVQIEKSILRKSVYDAQLVCYEKIKANSYIIYPYKNVNGRPKLICLEDMVTNYPCAYAYLERHKTELSKRNMPGRNETNWYAFGRSQSIKRFMSGQHLVWPVLSVAANYVYDNEMVAFTGGGNGPFYGLEMREGVRESIFYVQAILNHWLMELLVKSKASTFRGDYYSHGKQFIEMLPIYRIDYTNADEVKIHDRIVEHVQTLMTLKQQANNERNNANRIVMERAIHAVNKELEQMIDGLYQVQNQEGGEQE